LEAHPWAEDETRFRWLDSGTPGLSSRGVSEALDLNGARSLYGWTKLSAEQLIEEYRAAYGLQAIVNRCGVVAGPWQFGTVDQGVIGLWVIAHLLERPLSYIGYGGKGKQVRDLLHVDDLCDLILSQIDQFDAWEGWLGNVSGGIERSVSLCELTAKCRSVTGKSVPIREVAQTRPNDLRLFIGAMGDRSPGGVGADGVTDPAQAKRHKNIRCLGRPNPIQRPNLCDRLPPSFVLFPAHSWCAL
jgi:CDP-paratose 2-epimerase